MKLLVTANIRIGEQDSGLALEHDRLRVFEELLRIARREAVDGFIVAGNTFASSAPRGGAFLHAQSLLNRYSVHDSTGGNLKCASARFSFISTYGDLEHSSRWYEREPVRNQLHKNCNLKDMEKTLFYGKFLPFERDGSEFIFKPMIMEKELTKTYIWGIPHTNEDMLREKLADNELIFEDMDTAKAENAHRILVLSQDERFIIPKESTASFTCVVWGGNSVLVNATPEDRAYIASGNGVQPVTCAPGSVTYRPCGEHKPDIQPSLNGCNQCQFFPECVILSLTKDCESFTIERRGLSITRPVAVIATEIEASIDSTFDDGTILFNTVSVHIDRAISLAAQEYASRNGKVSEVVDDDNVWDWDFPYQKKDLCVVDVEHGDSEPLKIELPIPVVEVYIYANYDYDINLIRSRLSLKYAEKVIQPRDLLKFVKGGCVYEPNTLEAAFAQIDHSIDHSFDDKTSKSVQIFFLETFKKYWKSRSRDTEANDPDDILNSKQVHDFLNSGAVVEEEPKNPGDSDGNIESEKPEEPDLVAGDLPGSVIQMDEFLYLIDDIEQVKDNHFGLYLQDRRAKFVEGYKRHFPEADGDETLCKLLDEAQRTLQGTEPKESEFGLAEIIQHVTGKKYRVSHDSPNFESEADRLMSGVPAQNEGLNRLLNGNP